MLHFNIISGAEELATFFRFYLHLALFIWVKTKNYIMIKTLFPMCYKRVKIDFEMIKAYLMIGNLRRRDEFWWQRIAWKQYQRYEHRISSGSPELRLSWNLG